MSSSVSDSVDVISRYTSLQGKHGWNWTPVLDFLSCSEVAAVAQSCRQWSAQLRALHSAGLAPRTLVLNGSSHCAALLAAAAAHPSLRLSLQCISLEFCNSLQNFDLTPLGKFPKLTHLNLNACRKSGNTAKRGPMCIAY
jgi:hypothetical protein